MMSARAAAALVALEGRTEVTIKDVGRVIGLCLGHRMRKDVMDGIDNDSKVGLLLEASRSLGSIPPEEHLLALPCEGNCRVFQLASRH